MGRKRSEKEWGEGDGWWREVIRTSLGRKREGKARDDGCMGPRDSRIF